MASSSSSQVRVGVRIRPLTSKEISQGGHMCLNVTSPCIGIGQRRFTYDTVFDTAVGQQELYDSIALPLLKSFTDGYNATIMAYGQTGSGKTFTMGSEAHIEPDAESHTGLIPRFVADFFAAMKEKKEESDCGKESQHILIDFSLSASFLEVYGEDIHDLLDPHRKSLPIRENSDGEVVMNGLTNRSVSNANEALQVLHEGTMNRTTAATLMNLTSSRSHAVFTIYLTQIIRDDEVDVKTVSKFTFVDLAGSERMKKTGAEGERAREGIKINEGLLALGNVINALADEERLSQEKKVHVPYRQSKLTRLLQDALGGNSQTLFLACVSPSDTNASETLSTLHYANRARNIRNAPTKNVDAAAAELQRLKSLSFILQCELVKEKFVTNHNGSPSMDPSSSSSTFSSSALSASQSAMAQQSSIGAVDSDLLQRDDVKEYLQLILSKASDGHSGVSFDISSLKPTAAPSSAFGTRSMTATSGMPPRPFQHSTIAANNHPTAMDPAASGLAALAIHKSDDDRFHNKLLDDVDPDQDIAILDKLIELQRNEQDYENEQQRGEQELIQVDQEIEKEEKLLLRLKDKLKMYHNMKDKYEALMAEVQQLENEKQALASQLERAIADPTTGSSSAIRKKLEKVEPSLARAKRETQKHREMYRKVEQEAKRCRVLQRKISDLKADRISLIKRQKESEARYRDVNEVKTKQLLALKRKNRADGQKVSQLENEIRSQKTNLQKRKLHIDKLTTKLKQTESHFEKLWAMRQRDHKRRISSIGIGRRSSIAARWSVDPHHAESGVGLFAELSDAIASLKQTVTRLVAEQVEEETTREKFEDKVNIYNDNMRLLIDEVNKLNNLEGKARHDGFEATQEWRNDIAECRQAVADLEFKIEVFSAELDQLRKGLPGEKPSRIQEEEQVRSVLGEMQAPALRTSLLEAFSAFAESEMLRHKREKELERKDICMKSVENELDLHKSKLLAMTKDLKERRILTQTGEDVTAAMTTLKTENQSLTAEIAKLREQARGQAQIIEQHKDAKDTAVKQAHEATEALAVTQASLEQHNLPEECVLMTQSLQTIWAKLGVESSIREQSTELIRSSVTTTCAEQLKEAQLLEAKTMKSIDEITTELQLMRKAMGKREIETETDKNMHMHMDDGETQLLPRLEILKTERETLKPEFDAVHHRNQQLVQDTRKISASIHLSETKLPPNLKLLMQYSQVNTERAKDKGRRKRAGMMKDIASMMDALDSALTTEASLPQISEDGSTEHAFDIDDNRGRMCDDGIPDSDDAGDTKSGSSHQTFVELEEGCLEAAFLDRCDQELTNLRVTKSQLLVKAREILQTGSAIVQDMHMTNEELRKLINPKMSGLAWWNPTLASDIINFLNTSHSSSINTSPENLRHLEHVADMLVRIGQRRKHLTNVLRQVIEKSQKALLNVVGKELGVQQAYAAFHEALVRLPPLSRDLVDTCTSELEALSTGVDTMTQSEIEALTVVWEAMSVSSTSRQRFWYDMETSMNDRQFDNDSLFAPVEASRSDEHYSEPWVASTCVRTKRQHAELERKLFKLNAVHEEVERLRLRQDGKSRILSLESEVRMLNARLREVDSLKADRRRPFGKLEGGKSSKSKSRSKSKSKSKEELLRRDMKQKIASKLDQLSEAMETWQVDQDDSNNSNAGAGADTDTDMQIDGDHERATAGSMLLSEEVRRLLKNPDGNIKSGHGHAKRPKPNRAQVPFAPSSPPSSPPSPPRDSALGAAGHKRHLESHVATNSPAANKGGPNTRIKYRSGLTPPRKKYAGPARPKLMDRSIAPRPPLLGRLPASSASIHRSAKAAGSKRDTSAMSSAEAPSKKRAGTGRDQSAANRNRSATRTRRTEDRDGSPLRPPKMLARKKPAPALPRALSKPQMSPEKLGSSKAANVGKKSASTLNKRPATTLLPFGHVLAKVASPPGKENSSM